MFGGGYMHNPFFFGGLGFWFVWDMVWKGIAMWRAARRKELWWFVGLMLVNSVGILPIAYLMIWGKDDPDMVKMSKSVKIAKKKKK